MKVESDKNNSCVESRLGSALSISGLRRVYDLNVIEMIADASAFGLLEQDVYVHRKAFGVNVSSDEGKAWTEGKIVEVEKIRISTYKPAAQIVKILCFRETKKQELNVALDDINVIFHYEVTEFDKHDEKNEDNDSDSSLLNALQELALRGCYDTKKIQRIADVSEFLSTKSKSEGKLIPSRSRKRKKSSQGKSPKIKAKFDQDNKIEKKTKVINASSIDEDKIVNKTQVTNNACSINHEKVVKKTKVMNASSIDEDKIVKKTKFMNNASSIVHGNVLKKAKIELSDILQACEFMDRDSMEIVIKN
jgi:hypothetical protein